MLIEKKVRNRIKYVRETVSAKLRIHIHKKAKNNVKKNTVKKMNIKHIKIIAHGEELMR